MELKKINYKGINYKNINYKSIIYTLLGILAFFMIGRYAKIPTGVKGVYIFLQYWVLVYLAGRYGPVCGGIVGFFGHFLFECSKNDTIKWSWIAGSALVGILIGYIVKKCKIDILNPKRKDRTHFAMINIGVQGIVWCLVVPLMNILIYHMSFDVAIKRGLLAAANDILTSVILCDLLLYSYDHIIVRRIVALVTGINTLILLSYGNHGFGSICVYAAAIIICIYVFMHARIKRRTIHGFGKALRILLHALGILFLSSFFLLHVLAQVGRPDGNEKCMIILGAALNGEKPSKILKCRLDTAIEYIEDHPDIMIITSGGKGEDEIISEGEAMRFYLVNHGVDPDNIVVERKSTTTEENFGYSLLIMKEIGFDENTPTIFVTNDFHCFRAKQYATMEGLKYPKPLSAPTPAALILNSYFRETFSIGKYLVKYITEK